MPNYGYEALEGGVVDLPSGKWQWFPSRLIALPERTCAMQALVLGHTESPGSTMRVRVAVDVAISDENVADLAAHPDERWVTIDGQGYRVEPPLDGDPEPMWRVSGPNRQRWETDWEIDVPLGALTEADLIAIARSGL